MEKTFTYLLLICELCRRMHLYEKVDKTTLTTLIDFLLFSYHNALVYRNNCLICKVASNHVGNLPTRTLSLPADFYDCSVICKNVEKHDGCDLFLFEDQICYLGKSSYTTGDMDGLKNATFWATSASLNSITSDVGLKDDVLSESWISHVL